ncbi:MAG: glutamate formiminotransferase [Acidimicrobiales bacterium]|nr:MAG: glutamate formiminotransferase [Acidimicrobiales bacterium]
MTLLCVPNISEGARLDLVEELRRTVAVDLLDLHVDPHHNRSVFTLVGEEAPRRLARAAVHLLDISRHVGVHPRIGVVDVVPFVPYGDDVTMDEALQARDSFAEWMASELGVGCYLYGPERTLPEVRRMARRQLDDRRSPPDVGPADPHPTAGFAAVGARLPLVAYNLWIADGMRHLDATKKLARELRSPSVRTLVLQPGGRLQLSMNLVDPWRVTPKDVYETVSTVVPVERAELVGLIPRPVLEMIDPEMWELLDLGEDKTIESRLSRWHTS